MVTHYLAGPVCGSKLTGTNNFSPWPKAHRHSAKLCCSIIILLFCTSGGERERLENMYMCDKHNRRNQFLLPWLIKLVGVSYVAKLEAYGQKSCQNLGSWRFGKFMRELLTINFGIICSLSCFNINVLRNNTQLI